LGDPNREFLSQLHRLLSDYYSLEELRDLSLALGLDYDELSGERKSSKTWDLIRQAVVQQRMPELLAIAAQQRPQVDWPAIPPGFGPKALPRPLLERRLQASLAILAAAIVLLLIGLGWLAWSAIGPQPATPTPVRAFTIAVARFASLDAQGQAHQTEVSQSLTSWLYQAMENNSKNLLPSLTYQVLGPEDTGEVSGATFAERSEDAQAKARALGATVLVYGIVNESPQANTVSLEFYVADQSFDFGKEIIGADRLGQAVAFSLPLDPAGQSAVNAQLYGRVSALRYLIQGLSRLYSGEYESAAASFDWAANHIPEWREEQGKEVAWLLEGAARMRVYERQLDAYALSQAEQAYSAARQANPDYARAYLGLGTVAAAQAGQIDPRSCLVTAVDPARLADAEGLFRFSLQASEQTPSAFIAAKANYGLGQVHLLGFGHHLVGFSAEQSRRAFEATLEAYAAANYPADLARLAAHTHAQLGLLAGLQGDHETLLTEVSRAIDQLQNMPESAPQEWIARYWAWIATANRNLGRKESAISAYQQAIQASQGLVCPGELEEWQKQLDQLMQGGAL
jgi:tetratricopeptide (TPR) repeat protein